MGMRVSSGGVPTPFPGGSSVPPGVLFFDDFAYDVPESNPGSFNDINNPFVTAGGWDRVKANNINGGYLGVLSTTDTIPGYAGQMPIVADGGKLLKVHQQSGSAQDQTDFYLQKGDGTSDAVVPADVWWQFWIYPQNYGAESGNLGTQDGAGVTQGAKLIYPTRVGWPAEAGSRHSGNWLLSLKNNNGNPVSVAENSSQHNLFFENANAYGNSPHDYHWDDAQAISDGIPFNFNQTNGLALSENQWWCVRIHQNNAATGTKVYEAWARPMGNQVWTKIAEWVDGATVNGSPVTIGTTTDPANPTFYGMHGFRLFTTFGRAVNQNPVGNSDSWMYLAGFAMAAGVESGGNGAADLPVYLGF